MISLKQIQYALAVSRTLHFKRAVEICSVSQSALSTALAEMEKQLGFKVFERNNKTNYRHAGRLANVGKSPTNQISC